MPIFVCIGITSIITLYRKTSCQGAVNSLGVDAISAYTATGRIEDVILAFGNSGSEATSIFIAQNTGAKIKREY